MGVEEIKSEVGGVIIENRLGKFEYIPIETIQRNIHRENQRRETQKLFNIPLVRSRILLMQLKERGSQPLYVPNCSEEGNHKKRHYLRKA